MWVEEIKTEGRKSKTGKNGITVWGAWVVERQREGENGQENHYHQLSRRGKGNSGRNTAGAPGGWWQGGQKRRIGGT